MLGPGNKHNLPCRTARSLEESNLFSISVVIPACNAAPYIAAAIESALHQSCGRLEIIVVDDGSSDQTRQVVARYAPTVRYAYQDCAGPSSARNRGIDLAAGQLIAFLDADDLWHPNKMAVQMARFADRAELVACAARVQNFLSEEYQDPPAAFASGPGTQPTTVTLGSTLVARRSLFDAVGMLNPDYRHRDLQDLMVRADDAGLVTEILPDILARRRVHANNMSHGRCGADQMELIAITRARHARRRSSHS